MFGTLTKADAKYLGTENLKKICGAVGIPVVAIGGVSADNIPQLENCGISGVAVVSAIFGADNICSTAQKLRKLADSVIYGGYFENCIDNSRQRLLGRSGNTG